MGKYRDQEQLVDQYLSQGNKEAAVKLLFELVNRLRERKRTSRKPRRSGSGFLKSTLWLLTEIIRSGEIIEEEKSEAIDKGHREIWSKLYNMLTVDEANALYFALETVVHEPEETIFRQGEKTPRLYL